MSVPGRIQLCEAIWQGDLAGVKKWLNPDNMERTNWRGWNSVVLACQAGNVEIVRYLKSQGAKMNVEDKQGRTLLHHAHQSVELVQLLLDSGLDVNRKDGLGNTPLHACNPNQRDVVRRLLEAGASVYATNHNNLTPLAKFVSHDIVGLLLEYTDSEVVLCKRRHCNCRKTVFFCNLVRSISSGQTLNPNTKHFVKSICANLRDPVEALWVCNARPGSAMYELASFGSFKTECQEELKRMETEKVCGSSASYVSVWNQSRSALRNPVVQQAMSPDHCIRTFPIYGETLRKRFVDGMKRLTLLDQAVDSFVVHVPPLPVESVVQVLDHLSMLDLRNLIFVCGSKRKAQPDNMKRPCEETQRISKTPKRT